VPITGMRCYWAPLSLLRPSCLCLGLVNALPSPARSGGDLRLLGSAAHVDGHGMAPASPPPQLGEHTREVLRGLGYDEAQIDRLMEEGAV
jgi:crotonobetainyl-CoA:carnitine CoA-transferase CaiB-like acyl-CoA transferase